MISTDACGKGSRVYGKTSNHLITLRSVLLDGSSFESCRIGAAELERLEARDDLIGEVHRVVNTIVTTRRGSIAKQFPRLARFLTGYNLAHVLDDEGGFNLNYILAGSEGTLAVVTEAKLKLTRIPKHKQLFALRYADFDSALRAPIEALEHERRCRPALPGLDLLRGKPGRRERSRRERHAESRKPPAMHPCSSSSRAIDDTR